MNITLQGKQLRTKKVKGFKQKLSGNQDQKEIFSLLGSSLKSNLRLEQKSNASA